MKLLNTLYLLLAVVLLNILLPKGVNAQSSFLDVLPLNGKYSFTASQVPDKLVPVANYTTTFQWESSTSPTSGFTSISGATGPELVFTAPLTQTTYYRRKTFIFFTIGSYSNVVKLSLVSNDWEDRNYIREHDVKISGVATWSQVDNLSIGDKFESTTFLDGLGRPVQKLSRETGTPDAAQPNNWKDNVQHFEYDGLGRKAKSYLPYSTTTNTGKFKTTAATDQAQYYTNVYGESSPFSAATFDNSPLDRINNLKQSGTAWAAANGEGSTYDFNDLNENVQRFTIGYNTGDVPVNAGAYPEKSLFKLVYTDENNKKVIEYSDKAGRLVLTKIQLDDNPTLAHTGYICTYNIYDEFGNLRYQLQPEAVKYLDANGWSFTGTNGQAVLAEQCFRYEYDEKTRLVLKKAPGAEELMMLYDQRDRKVFTQDGNQRALSTAEWTAYLYDELDRHIITTLYHTSKTVAQLKSDIAAAATTSTMSVTNPSTAAKDIVVDKREVTITTYEAQTSVELITGFESGTSDVFTAQINATAVNGPVTVSKTTYKSPISNADLSNASLNTVIKYLFYDDYNFAEAASFRSDFDNALAYTTGQPIVKSERNIGMVTGVMSRVLGSDMFLTTTNYFDDEARPIQQLEENIKNGIDVTTIQYSFDGRVLSTNIKHTSAGSEYLAFSTVSKNVYDKIGRVISIEKKYGTNPFKVIADYSFDDAGRLKSKRLSPGYTGSGKSELETLDYSYNLHGNITGINKDYALKTPGKYNKWGNFFGLYLGYDNRDNVFTAANLTSKVTGLLWNTMGDDAQRKYDYEYDNAGRLVKASFNEKQSPGDTWSNAKLDFSVNGTSGKITYDLNGNLLNMLQKGVIPGTATPVTVDNLQYTYFNLSNRLQKVTDNGTMASNNGKLGDFADGTNGAGNDYVYDDNGNVIVDLNKNATELGGIVGGKGIRYNFLDKPEEIRIKGKGVITIVYDADGNRLQKKFLPEGGSVESITSYINGFVYKGETVQYITFEEGRIRPITQVNQNNGFDALNINGSMDLPGGKRGVYDYFIRDYQENVRMILTEEIHTGSNVCTMELNRAANEEPLFGKVDVNGNPASGNEVQARFAVSSIPGQSGGGGWQNSAIGDYVSRIGNLAGSKVGPNSLLRVMAGDEVSATTIYYYQTAVTNTVGNTTLLTNLLASLGQAISGSGVASAMHAGASANITSMLNNSVPFTGAVAPDANNATGTSPKAYLSVMFFDERFNFVSTGSATARVSQAGSGAPALVLSSIKAPKNGYAFVYVSNESDQMVYFDNLQVSQVHGRILEENHYYAYGLKIAGISSRKLSDINEGAVKNNYLYNDKELIDDADLGWYDYGYRSYDPQIGRFTQLDPLTWDYFELTPYQYASNDPIGNIDLDGLEGVSSVVNKADFFLNAAGNIAERTLNTVVVTATKNVSWWKKVSKVVTKVADVATDFIPVVSGLKDIYQGVKNGNGWQVALGVGSIAADVFTLGSSSIAKGAVKTAVKEGAGIIARDIAEQVIKEEAEQVVSKSIRQRAVRQAWKEEKALLKETGQGTREWTEKETKELLEKGKVKGYQGHHINNVKHHPSQAGNPNNIKFVTPKEHLLEHGGNFKNKTTGELLNRALN